MSCERYRSRLTDVALGAPATSALESHLEACPGCSAALGRERALLARIDREIQSTLELTPSAGLPARARQVAPGATPISAVWKWLAPSAVLACVLALVYLAGYRADTPPRARPRAAVNSAVDVQPSLSRPAESSHPAQEHRVRAAGPRRETPPADLSDVSVVIIPPGQEDAVRRVIAAMRGLTFAPGPAQEGDFKLPAPRVDRGDATRAVVRLYPNEPGEPSFSTPESRPLTIEPDEWRIES